MKASNERYYYIPRDTLAPPKKEENVLVRMLFDDLGISLAGLAGTRLVYSTMVHTPPGSTLHPPPRLMIL